MHNVSHVAAILQLHKWDSKLHVQVGKHSRVGSLLFERNSQAQSSTLGETALLPLVHQLGSLSLPKICCVLLVLLTCRHWLGISRSDVVLSLLRMQCVGMAPCAPCVQVT